MTEMMELAKDLKTAIVHVFEDLKENMNIIIG